MAVSIGINGFGRIGRYLTRLLAYEKDVTLTCVNARASNADLAHLLKYDSVHGPFKGRVSANDAGMKINGKQVNVTRCPIGEWEWKEQGCDLVVETTGKIKDRDGLAVHLAKGAKKAIISAPGQDVDLTVVMGVNDQLYDPARHDVISNASCTTNCLAPVAKLINDAYGIERGHMTTVHSYTMNQRILDGSHKDLRRGRACAMSMVPTTTGATKATGLVIPELEGKLAGLSIRVPTPNVSLVDLTCELATDVTEKKVNAMLKKAARTTMNPFMGYCEEPLVSVDYIGSIHGGVVDAPLTSVTGKRLLKVIVWYDNESGFTHQLLRLVRKVAASM
ncbi:MAG: type I glyceraldehyde-3-phosphate dehydrogenase [Desulfovibrionaceae bacterium]|jgi:glyceraldehyde 3-phosphate dehydrogenase|nr:type I glyceraldehyde-3-phosphate dehydrogenase [Desulfovibrionaceae bacterium]